MTSNFMKYKIFTLVFAIICVASNFSQTDTSQWKFQIGIGFNNPIDNVKEDNFYSLYVNFPSINLGIQHMFNQEIGAKLDFGYNRAVNGNGSAEFKFNYSRINAQFIYDFTYIMNFLPAGMAFVGHVGPGISFTKPLGNFTDNTYTFPNLLGGFEVHFGVARTVSVYADLSYALSLSSKEKYDPIVDGFSFNGDINYISLGVSVSLSGCYYCD